MDPMFLREVVEGDEVVPVALQAFRCRALANGAPVGAELVPQLLALGSSGCLVEFPELLADLAVEPLGQLVDEVHCAMVPTTSVAGLWENVVEGRPDAERAVPDHQQRRLGHTPRHQ